MPIDLSTFEPAYEKWVEESLPDYRAGNMKEIIKKYPFVVPDGIPWTVYNGQPSNQTFALLTTGGFYLNDSQPPFDTESIHGDVSLREIPKTVRQQDIGIAHLHYDHSLTEQDMNIVFPIQRLAELEAEGIIGKLTDTHYYGCAGGLADHDRTGNNSRAALQMEAAGSGVSGERIERM